MVHDFQTVAVERAAEAYVLSRRKARFLSMAMAIRVIRTLMPACTVTDQMLEELFAEACIAHGVPVAFDTATASGLEMRLHS